MIGKYLESVRAKNPLVHNITNYVTVNDCANILLACGASPIMADDIAEVKDITSICGGLNINIGTLNQRTIESMISAGKKSNELEHLVILDPVGVGASTLRTNTALKLLDEVKFSVIRGNISEIKALALGSSTTKGVDADTSDLINDKTLDATIEFAKKFAKQTNAVIVITGATDIVLNANSAFTINNGHSMMSKITGTGCMLTAMLAAYIIANRDNTLEASLAAVCAMGICGELAYKRLTAKDGNATYRNFIIDEVYNLNAQMLEKHAKYELL